MQAEYDMSTLVKHNDTQTVLVDRKIDVDGTHTETIKGNTAITVSEGKYEHTVATGIATIKVKDAVTEVFENTQSTTVTNGITITSKTADMYVQTATKIDLHVGDSRVVMTSDGTITITGKNITVDGSETVTVKSGGSQIVLTPNDIKTKSALVEVVGTSKASMGVTSQTVVCDTSKVAVSGAAVNASAVGMHEITGAVVKIN